MIKLYTSPSCSSCRKVKKYFELYNVDYVEKNIINTPLLKDDIYRMLLNSENGFDDIISTRSKVFKENNLNIDDMNTNQLIEFIIANPSVLKRPIIVSDYETQVGYNDDDIGVFIPKEVRQMSCLHCLGDEDCEYVKSIKFK